MSVAITKDKVSPSFNNNSSSSTSVSVNNAIPSPQQLPTYYYHHISSLTSASAYLSSRPLPPAKNFSLGVDFDKPNSSIVHHHNKVYVLNNCSDVKLLNEAQPDGKRIRVIYSSDEE